jgi:hypothetical protein
MRGLVSTSVHVKRLTVNVGAGGSEAIGQLRTHALRNASSRTVWPQPPGQATSWLPADDNRARARLGKLEAGGFDG